MTAVSLVISRRGEKKYGRSGSLIIAFKFLLLLTVHERLCTKRHCECHLSSLSSCFSLLSQIANIFISAIYTKSTANTASNPFITLPFKWCKQRVNVLLKCRICFHHRWKKTLSLLTELCIRIWEEKPRYSCPVIKALTSEVWAKFPSLPLTFQATWRKTSFMHSWYSTKNHLTPPFCFPFLPFVYSVNLNGVLLWS